MSDYKDIPLEPDERLRTCCVCSIELPGNDSPWSICYDPQWKDIAADSHEYRGLLCQQCAERTLLARFGDTVKTR